MKHAASTKISLQTIYLDHLDRLIVCGARYAGQFLDYPNRIVRAYFLVMLVTMIRHYS